MTNEGRIDRIWRWYKQRVRAKEALPTDAQWLDSPTAAAEIGGIFGRHHPGRLLVLHALHHDIRPATVQHVLHLTPLDILVRDHCSMLTASHAGEADARPSSAATRHAVSNASRMALGPGHGSSIFELREH
jgi:hypothetical protein